MKSLCQGILLRNIVSSLAHTAFNEQWCAWEKGILSFNAAKSNHFDGFQNEFDGWRMLCQVDYSEVGYSVSFCWWVLTLQTNRQLEFPPVVRRRETGSVLGVNAMPWAINRSWLVFGTAFFNLYFCTFTFYNNMHLGFSKHLNFLIYLEYRTFSQK